MRRFRRAGGNEELGDTWGSSACSVGEAAARRAGTCQRTTLMSTSRWTANGHLCINAHNKEAPAVADGGRWLGRRVSWVRFGALLDAWGGPGPVAEADGGGGRSNALRPSLDPDPNAFLNYITRRVKPILRGAPHFLGLLQKAIPSLVE